jgi:dihydrofolate reductase
MTITIIAAVARNGVIGHQGRIPWHLPADLAHFKRTTMGHTLVMGRRTFEATGALPGRRTLVLTRDPDWQPRPAGEGGEAQVEVVCSLDHAIDRARDLGEIELFICGGEEVYRQALPKADRIVLTRVESEPEGDTHFPAPDWTQWRLASREDREPDERNPHVYRFEIHERLENVHPG